MKHSKAKWMACLMAAIVLLGGVAVSIQSGLVSAATTTYRTGDLNADGVVNSKDLVRMMKCLSSPGKVEVNEMALDTNGDGTFNSKDLARLKRYLSGTADLAEVEIPVETESESETWIEESKRTEIEAYLDTVSYLDFELTGETTPYYLGRWFEKDIGGVSHMVTVTDGSLLYFLTDGATEIQVNFTNITPTIATPYFAYSIDGATPVRRSISYPRIVLPDDGMHTVRIIADGMTEGDGTPKWVNEEGFALQSITTSGGSIYGIKPTEKVIFYYGDSITEGINAIGTAANSHSNSATNAYSWFTSEYLGAVGYIIGHGASGLTRTGSFTTMLNAIDKLSSTRDLADHPNADITPDLIVVNHGANDGMAGTSADAFETALRETLTRLQAKYPDVVIIYVMPLMEDWQENVKTYSSRVDKVAAELSDVYVIHTNQWGLDRGLDFTDSLHPHTQGAMKVAGLLVPEIRKIVGEDFFN